MPGMLLRILPLPLLSASMATLAEPPSKPAEPEVLDRILTTIEQEQSQHGTQSKDLIEPLTGLASLYQATGNHPLAAAVIEQALQIVRANYGLHSLEQVPLIRRSILTESATGNVAGAWEHEQELLELASRHPEDLRIVPILREIADGRMDLLGSYANGEFPPQIVLGCYYKPEPSVVDESGSCISGSRGHVIRSILLEAQRMYLEAVATLVRHELYSSPELRETELGTVRNTYLYRDYLAEAALYEFGRERLQNLASYAELRSALLDDRISALIRIADWDLMFSRNGQALEEYADVYGQLGETDGSSTSRDDIFSPTTPVVLPSFLPNPLISEETGNSVGYIDVGFEITRFGIGRNVHILDSSVNASDAARNRLTRLIKGCRFRPIMTDGHFGRKSVVVLRYYIAA